MASSAVELLIGKLWSALENEISSLGGIRCELEDLKRELETMRSFLEEAERRHAQLSQVQKTWVESVREIAYEVEDIIDEFTYHMNGRSSRNGLFVFFKKIIHFPKSLWLMHQTGSRLQKIMKDIKAIADRSHRYHIEGDGVVCDQKWPFLDRESIPHIKEDDVIGMDDETQLLKKKLMGQELRQKVISVVGMGGSGKTTLVAKVYNDDSVKRHFDCCAWISVSQSYERRCLLRRLIKEVYQESQGVVPNDLDNKDLKDLVQMLLCYLQSKRFLIVLDDVWDTKLWDAIRVSLPNNHRLGSRILITTRQEEVASFCFGVKSHVLRIQPLSETEAWSLFCMKAFSSCPGNACPVEFEALACELVRKCGGLPLAIVALGGLMHSKKLVMEWSDVLNNLNWQLSNNGNLEVIQSILLLSFHDLPYPLKHCFLYCSLFPEDYLIRRKRLIKLWMAEGFVRRNCRIMPEDEANNYLMQLISRNMLQVVDKNPSGRPKAMKMHDLLREIAMSISEKENFCTTYDGRIPIEQCQARRLSVQTIERVFDNAYSRKSQLRSFFMFARNFEPRLSVFLSKLKLLRVLDLQGVAIDKLPDELGSLFNLRYLNLRETRVSELPTSIDRLCNLQTLDIKDTRITRLPIGVANLKNLWHLIMYRYNHGHYLDFRCVFGTRMPFKISKLQNLQAMSFVEAEGNIIREIGNMVQLTRIGISNLRESDEIEMCTSLSKLKLVHNLFLMASDEEETLRVHKLSKPPPLLKKLFLTGKLETVPRWVSSLQCLTYLYLHWSRLKEDPLPHVAGLPSLGKLSLCNAFTGEKLHFFRGFTKLKILVVANFPQLNGITFEKGVMPEIQTLRLIYCMELNAPPAGIEHLNNLQELTLESVSTNLVETIGGEDSDHRSRVQHIPKIKHYYFSESGFHCENLS